MSAPFSPTRGKIKPGHVTYTDTELGVAEGSGADIQGESLSMSDEQVSLVRERRLVFDETLILLDAQTGMTVEKVFTERVPYSELPNAYLNSAIVKGPERATQNLVSTLTTTFGQGGFGQLGLGGSVDVTG